MAVYTDVSDDDVSALLAHYDVGQLLSFKGIAEGVENSNFLLTTEKGQFILTLYEKRVLASDLPFFLQLMEHLAARGVNCPLPVKDMKGAVLQTVSGKPAAMITFLQGVSVRRPQAYHCAALGQTLARMHKATEDFTGTRKNSLSLAGWQHLAQNLGERLNDLGNGLYDEVARALASLSVQWPEALPQGVIHADLFPDNVFFIGEKLSGVIDFYFACTDTLAYDLAICLNAWCFEADGSYNATKGQALLQGYQRERALSREEQEALPQLARGAALRFLLTRAHDWLHTPQGALVTRKDPLEYARKLRFHQKVMNVREYGL